MKHTSVVLTAILVISFLIVPDIYAQDALERGRTAYTQGRHKQAAVEYQRALRSNPHSADAKLGLAQSYEILGKLQDASRYAGEVLQANPNDGQALLLLGRIRTREENWSSARDAFRAAVQADPRNPSAHLGLGNALSRLGDAAGAEAEFDTFRRLAVGTRP